MVTKNKRILAFNEKLCDLCGLCLHLCPVMQLPLNKAKAEIQNLIEGKNSNYVLLKCTTCVSCNLYCPQKANPYQLILERWNDLYKKRGLAPIFKFICPTETPNLWQLLNIFLSNQERKLIYKWMKNIPKPDDTVLLIDSFIHLYPFIIAESKLFEKFTLVDRLDHWCAGGYLYQLGIMDVVQDIAEITKEDLNKWGVKNIITTLDAMHHMFNEVHPKEMRVLHEQNIININRYFRDKINSGDIKLPKAPLNMIVTVHDNCFSKVKDCAYWDDAREILKKCGCKIVEMRHYKKDSLCCGWGAGASWKTNFSLIPRILSEGFKKFKEAENTSADALVCYCEGCNFVLWILKEILGSKIKIYHIIEIIRMAMGEKLNHPRDNIKRAWDIIAIITYQIIVSLFQKNFFIKQIRYDKAMNNFQPRKYFLLKAIRFLLNISITRKIFTKLFQILLTFD